MLIIDFVRFSTAHAAVVVVAAVIFFFSLLCAVTPTAGNGTLQATMPLHAVLSVAHFGWDLMQQEQFLN